MACPPDTFLLCDQQEIRFLGGSILRHDQRHRCGSGVHAPKLLPPSRHSESVLTLPPPFHRCFVIPAIRGQVEAPLLLLLGHLQVKTSAALWRQLVTPAEQRSFIQGAETQTLLFINQQRSEFSSPALGGRSLPADVPGTPRKPLKMRQNNCVFIAFQWEIAAKLNLSCISPGPCQLAFSRAWI